MGWNTGKSSMDSSTLINAIMLIDLFLEWGLVICGQKAKLLLNSTLVLFWDLFDLFISAVKRCSSSLSWKTTWTIYRTWPQLCNTELAIENEDQNSFLFPVVNLFDFDISIVFICLIFEIGLISIDLDCNGE